MSPAIALAFPAVLTGPYYAKGWGQEPAITP
jgi:hypothetical protein